MTVSKTVSFGTKSEGAEIKVSKGGSRFWPEFDVRDPRIHLAGLSATVPSVSRRGLKPSRMAECAFLVKLEGSAVWNVAQDVLHADS